MNVPSSACITSCGITECQSSPNCSQTSRQPKTGNCQERLLAELKQQGLVDPDIYITRSNTLAEQLRTAKLEKERFLESEEDQTIRQTQVLLEILETGPEFLEAFDEELFSELVAKIIVENNECLRFRLINGLELTETIERTVR